MNWRPAESRLNPLGGQYVARIPGTTALDNEGGKIIHGFSTTATDAAKRLVKAFADIDHNIREEALEGIVSIGGLRIPLLLEGLREVNPDIAAGCAEALRQQQKTLPHEAIAKVSSLARKRQFPSWDAWLLGQLPRDQVLTTIADIQDSAPALHYALSLLWAFTESWIARRWELHPNADFPSSGDDAYEV